MSTPEYDGELYNLILDLMKTEPIPQDAEHEVSLPVFLKYIIE